MTVIEYPLEAYIVVLAEANEASFNITCSFDGIEVQTLAGENVTADRDASDDT